MHAAKARGCQRQDAAWMRCAGCLCGEAGVSRPPRHYRQRVLLFPPRVTAAVRERGSRLALLLSKHVRVLPAAPPAVLLVGRSKARRTFVPSWRNRKTVRTAALAPGAAQDMVRAGLSTQGHGKKGAPGDGIHQRHIGHVQRRLYCYDAALLLLCALHVLLHLSHSHATVSCCSRLGHRRAGRTRLKPSTTTLFWSRSTRAMVPTSPLSLPAMIFTCASSAASSVQAHTRTRQTQTTTCLVAAQDFPVLEQLAEATRRHIPAPVASLAPGVQDWAGKQASVAALLAARCHVTRRVIAAGPPTAHARMTQARRAPGA